MKNTRDSHTPITYKNGQPMETLSVQDRALQYGDGFFTTLLVEGRGILNWSAHWRRLKMSAERLQFARLEESQLLQQIAQAVVQFDPDSRMKKVVKLLVSRGASGRGYAIPEDATPLVLVQVSAVSQLNSPPPLLLLDTLLIETCKTQAAIQAQLAGIKHLNRLDSVLAQTEVQQKQHAEGIMLNAMGHVIGGTQSNLFLIKKNTFITPKLHLSGVAGTTRYQLSQLAASLGFEWQEAELSLVQVLEADELFLSNAVRGIMPIQQLNQQKFSTTQGLVIQSEWNHWQAKHAHFLEAIQ